MKWNVGKSTEGYGGPAGDRCGGKREKMPLLRENFGVKRFALRRMVARAHQGAAFFLYS
jgi:hypothetical protein